ncbi:MAG: ThiF family adenylyltransferase [Acidobacteria bacterium]|nr:ThiF family adenylyltransferase [Acidobacteriota bacterium]
MSDRYSRQVLFPGIGRQGQERIRHSRVLLVGCGALGSVIAEILVRAGVGSITIADRDYVDETNLQRQSLFTEEDWRASLPKAVAAERRLGAINSAVRVHSVVTHVRAGTIEELIAGQDLILDGTDNFETRYLLNDASLRWNVPWVYGACVGAYGMCVAFVPRRTPCLRCLLELMPPPGSAPTCDTAGVIGPIVHLVAAMQSAEALKLLTGRTDQLNRSLVCVDLWENRYSALGLDERGRNPDCPACGRGELEFLEGRMEGQAEPMCGRNAVQISRSVPRPVDFGPIAERLAAQGPVTHNVYLLKASFGGCEVVLFRDGRAIIRGTQDIEEARGIYSKLIGD